MATKLMEELAKSQGYCCLWSLFHYNRNVRTGAFAQRYGVSRQAIRYWRKRFAWGAIDCLDSTDCLLAREQSLRRASKTSR